MHDFKITSPVQIWSGDETGVQNIPKEEKFLCDKCKPAYQSIAADQGETYTVLTFVNGVGSVDLLTDALPVDSSTTDQVSLGLCALVVTGTWYLIVVLSSFMMEMIFLGLAFLATSVPGDDILWGSLNCKSQPRN